MLRGLCYLPSNAQQTARSSSLADFKQLQISKLIAKMSCCALGSRRAKGWKDSAAFSYHGPFPQNQSDRSCNLAGWRKTAAAATPQRAQMRLELQSQEQIQGKAQICCCTSSFRVTQQSREADNSKVLPQTPSGRAHLLGSPREANILSRRPDPAKNTLRLALQTPC